MTKEEVEAYIVDVLRLYTHIAAKQSAHNWVSVYDRVSVNRTQMYVQQSQQCRRFTYKIVDYGETERMYKF